MPKRTYKPAAKTGSKKKTVKQKPAKQKSSIDNRAFSIIMFAISALMFFVIFAPGENIWFYIHKFIVGLLGMGAVFLPVSLCYLSVVSAVRKEIKNKKMTLIVFGIMVLMLCSCMYVFSSELVKNQPKAWIGYIIENFKNSKLDGGPGILGAFAGAFLTWAFGSFGAKVSSVITIFICIMLISGMTLTGFFRMILVPLLAVKKKFKEVYQTKKITDNLEASFKKEPEKEEPIFKESSEPEAPQKKSEREIEDNISAVTEKFLSRIKNVGNNSAAEEKPEVDEELEKSETMVSASGEDNYEFPSIELLNKPPVPKDEDISAELNTNGRTLVDTLQSFNVQTKIVDISRGPAVTRYELQPASGVKISKITTLADDIALNLAAAGVRIEAPIPGKAAVGVEIPNKVVSMVGMRELISSSTFKSSKSKLTVVLGKDISGEVTVADLAKMPHLLIAGSTGSGKSVCINSFIISILYNAKPSEVRLLMIDPKVVELGIYNGIPHLLVPVVTDARKAAGALGWAVNEMTKRYKIFADNNVRDIYSYNEFVEQEAAKSAEKAETLEKMPKIVIVIDELSDLMMAAPNEVEDYICRLAQMARAAGMHLVIATQRPSVDVITGIIKANIPSRIALAVSSQIDSRTILDMSGAEKLLGRGDMLFSPAGSSKPTRVQGCYVTDKEIEKVIKYVKSSQQSDYDNNIAKEIEKNSSRENLKASDEKFDVKVDPVMKEAIKCVVEAGQASTSFLQRRLRVGYARAGRLIDEMEQMGIVGPHEGSKPRQVLINYQQFLEMNINS